MQLTAGLHRALQQDPDEPAVVFGDRTRTTREVTDRVARLASALQHMGVQAGDRVAILALNSDRYHEYLLAVPWANAIVVPLNIRWSAAEISHVLQDSEAHVLFVDDAFAAMLPELSDRGIIVPTIVTAATGPLPTTHTSTSD